MKTRTEIFTVTRLLVSAAAAAVLVLVACAPVTGPEVSAPPQGKGLVNIRLGIDGDPGPARTLVPASVEGSAFSSYTLVFTPEPGDPVTLEDQTDLTEIALNVGTYRLDLTAYTGAREGKKEAAAGAATGIAVNEGATATATVPLVFKPEAGTGALSFTVTRPGDFELSGAEFTLTPLHAAGTVYGTDWLQTLYAGETSHTATETVESGYYLATVTLSTPERKAVKTDIVHIGAGQTTTLDWTFSESDFATIVTELWLLGVGGEWQTTYGDGNKMTHAPDGTFVWDGTMSQGYFRFSLENTSGWTESKDKPGRFQPASDTNITLGTATGMTYVPQKTGALTAWNLGGTGYYQFVVNPFAKTVTVARPVTVTGVTIKGADGNPVSAISLPRGTEDYQFSAEPQGTNAADTGVEWAITDVSGAIGTTAIGTDGKLSIDLSATGGSSFTVTATSVADSTKSGSVTVTVTNLALPAPQSVSLSAQGVATWTAADETNVVEYSARLYKGTVPQGTAQGITKGATYSVDFLAAMRGAGTGSYTVKVKAVGDGTSYGESPEAESGSQSVSQKTAVTFVWWIDDTVAHWDTVSDAVNAADYTVHVYKDEAKVSSTTGTETYTETGKLKAYVDLAAIMAANGTGSYTFGVITKGDDELVLDSPETTVSTSKSYIATLSAPGKPGLSAGAVTWIPVSGASSYTVKLYKSGETDPVQTYANQSSGGSVLSDMRSNGAGSYTVTVSAIGDDTAWLSSAESPASDAETIAVLATPSGLLWNENSAEWTGVSNAASYTVKLYKGGILTETVPNASSPLDLAAHVTSAGSYTFTVQAISSTSGLYLDSAASAASGAKQVGGVASISLTPSNKSGTLTATGNHVSIAKSNGSLTISVSGGGFSSFVWIVDGVTLAGTTSSITLSGTDYSLGGHLVTVYALDGAGVPWSPVAPVSFTVTAN